MADEGRDRARSGSRTAARRQTKESGAPLVFGDRTQHRRANGTRPRPPARKMSRRSGALDSKRFDVVARRRKLNDRVGQAAGNLSPQPAFPCNWRDCEREAADGRTSKLTATASPPAP